MPLPEAGPAGSGSTASGSTASDNVGETDPVARRIVNVPPDANDDLDHE